MMFITHAMPNNLQVDEVVRIGQGSLNAVNDTHDETQKEAGGGAHGSLDG
jgi:ABC-type transport system involved in cytochrome bd biosynthesis fused ATPase/permease subunit